MEKVLVAMSGGVDSSVAAFLLQRAGYACAGATMRLHRTGDPEGGCCSLEDVEDARSVATALNMPYYVFNFSEEFDAQVVRRFIRAYEAGRTPNPCVDCNRYLKFERFFRRAQELGMDYVATGHYARIEKSGARYLLKKGVAQEKDQSYVLYAMTQEQLAHTRFPLGELRKDQVRAIAAERGLINAKKHDSQDICFVPDGDYAAFIRNYTGKDYPSGEFVDGEGNVLGRHKGIICYTVGQRRGLGVAVGKPVYVQRILPEKNQVVLAGNEQLFQSVAVAEEFNWIALDAPVSPIRAKARARYHQPEQPATARVLKNGRVRVEFDQPQRALTCGQAIVLYDGDVVLGGGTICKVE